MSRTLLGCLAEKTSCNVSHIYIDSGVIQFRKLRVILPLRGQIEKKKSIPRDHRPDDAKFYKICIINISALRWDRTPVWNIVEVRWYSGAIWSIENIVYFIICLHATFGVTVSLVINRLFAFNSIRLTAMLFILRLSYVY